MNTIGASGAIACSMWARTTPSCWKEQVSITSGRKRSHAHARIPSGVACSSSRFHSVTDTLRRSEEHTSELQSPYDLVCRLLLEKKKKKKTITTNTNNIYNDSSIVWCC